VRSRCCAKAIEARRLAIIAAIAGHALTPDHRRDHETNVGSTTVAQLITEESLDGLVKAVLLCVLASTLLAVAAYMGFRALPLRALDDTIAELENHRRFDVALNNMSQGLCVFDANRRLVVCNSRYASLYDLPADLKRPGTALEHIIRFSMATGRYAGPSPEEHARSIDAMIAAGTASTHVYDMRDARSIFVKFEPLDSGDVPAMLDAPSLTAREAA